MSSLWTPGGERPVPRSSNPDPEPRGGDTRGGGPPGPGGDAEDELSEEEMRQQVAEMRAQLAGTPADVVVANHAYGLFELAALHLSLERPQLDQARLAIDALGLLVEGLGDRLGEPAAELQAALGQLRMAFLQIQAGLNGPGPGPEPGG